MLGEGLCVNRLLAHALQYSRYQSWGYRASGMWLVDGRTEFFIVF